MALPLALFFVLRSVFAALPEQDKESSRALSFGYPDVLADSDQLAALFGEEIRDKLKIREDGARIAAWHNMTGKIAHVVETLSLFSALGLELETIDVHPSRGVERKVDLNHPLPADLAARYGLVLDLGTIEHCFNIGQAITNAAQATALGGFVVHANPMSMVNHGFYNLSPTFYVDFYEQNGFEVVFMSGIAGRVPDYTFFDIDSMKRIQVAADCSIIAVVRRREMRPIVWPTQAKYRANPALLG